MAYIKRLAHLKFLASLAAGLTYWPPLPAVAQGLGEVFKNQPLRLIVGSPPGGAYDLYARAIARHMGNHLPGQPSVVVQNMPGGGGYLAANFLFNNAPKDGSTIAMFSRSVPMQPLIDPAGVQFDPRKLEWIGNPSDEVSLVLAWHTSGIRSAQDLQAKGLTVAATGPGTDSNVFPRVVSNVLGANMKIVTGYRGAADILLAVERGEVEGAAGISWSGFWPAKKDWVESGKVNVLIQLALKSTRPQLKDVPLIIDLVKNDVDRRALEVIFARQTMAYPVAAPPGVSDLRLNGLREAFARTMADDVFLAETQKSGMAVNPVPPGEMKAIVERVYSSSPDIVGRVKALMEGGAAK